MAHGFVVGPRTPRALSGPLGHPLNQPSSHVVPQPLGQGEMIYWLEALFRLVPARPRPRSALPAQPTHAGTP